jgi:hypothetical protein
MIQDLSNPSVYEFGAAPNIALRIIRNVRHAGDGRAGLACLPRILSLAETLTAPLFERFARYTPDLIGKAFEDNAGSLLATMKETPVNQEGGQTP